MTKISFLIISILIFVSQSFSQNAGVLDSYKLSNIDFTKYKSHRTISDHLFVTVTPSTSKYPSSNFITDIIIAGDTVWFATGSGIMRTIDNFQNFQNYFGLSPFGDDDISGLSVNTNVVVTSTAISEEISGDNVPVGTGIKVSTDYGLNWDSYPQPMDGLNDTIVIYGANVLSALPVVVPQQNLSYDIAITKTQNDTNNFTIWITSFAGGLRKSTDYGNSWQRVVLPPDDLDSIYISGVGYNFAINPVVNLNHRAFTIEAANDSVLYVGTADGINKSTDWGISWRKYNFQNTDSNSTGFGVSGNFVVNLGIQKYNGNEIVWGATRRAEDNREYDALSYSSNRGLNWATTLNNIKPSGISFMDSLVYGLTEEGLWRAYFSIFNWSKPGLIVDEETNDVLRTEMFYSGNHINDTLYFGSTDGMIRTKEYGQPWIGKWKIFRAVTPIDLSSDIKTYAAPNPFSPDDEVVRIFYKTDKYTAKITIKIFDFGMNPARTVIQNATRSNTNLNEFYTQWDGKSNNGFRVANGVYFYRIEIDDDDDVWGKILVLQ
jgi:hypothetical protein